MSMITISRQVGSLGTEIAREVAGKLSYEYVDKEKIGKILADFGFGAPALEKFDEKKHPSREIQEGVEKGKERVAELANEGATGKIHCVDDDWSVLQLYHEELNDECYKVFIATDGKEAFSV